MANTAEQTLSWLCLVQIALLSIMDAKIHSEEAEWNPLADHICRLLVISEPKEKLFKGEDKETKKESRGFDFKAKANSIF